jgi:3-oxoacyl-[acyl-carrier-protein] synthase III
MSQAFGIAEIEVYDPPSLPNEWFETRGLIDNAKRYAKKRGIESRGVSSESEVTMARRAILQMRERTGLDLRRCAGLVFASTSLVPHADGWREDHRAALGGLEEAGEELSQAEGIDPKRVAVANFGCTGFIRSIEKARDQFFAKGIKDDEFILLATASRPSKHTDYADKATGSILGDAASATVLSPAGSAAYPPYALVREAQTTVVPTETPMFTYEWRQDVLYPAWDGGTQSFGEARDPRRLIWQMAGGDDFYGAGGGVGVEAPTMMFEAVQQALAKAGVAPRDVSGVVSHQAGRYVLLQLEERLRAAGIGKDVVLDGLRQRGNTTLTSIPAALAQYRERLHGIIACPATGLYAGDALMLSRGCLVLETAEVPSVPNAVVVPHLSQAVPSASGSLGNA